MSQIDALESRITAALERIGAGLDGLEMPVQQDTSHLDELETLRAALDDERTANAQLEERVRAIKEKQDGRVASLEAEVAEMRSSIAGLNETIERLRKANSELEAANSALRTSVEDGVAEPHLINKAMLAELESLRAARAVDLAEAGAVLAFLDPLVADAERAQDEEESA